MINWDQERKTGKRHLECTLHIHSFLNLDNDSNVTFAFID